MPPARRSMASTRRAWARRVAAITGFSLIPGLLTPIAVAESADPLGRTAPAAHRADKVSALTDKVNKKTAAQMRTAAAQTREAVSRAKTDQAKKPVWPTTGKATLAVPASGTVAAAPGSLPITLGLSRKAPKGATSATPAGPVTVEVLNRDEARRLDIDGLVVKVTGPATGGSTALGIDYSSFASAYGGDWAGRLQAQRLPECALTTPTAAKCRTRSPLTYTNDREQQQLVTQIDFSRGAAASGRSVAQASGHTMLMALTAGAASARGDYAATPLSASSSWEAGGSSGSFTWSYPIKTPPPAAGPKPSLSLSYDSGSVDGRTASTNNQGSLVGEGFDLTSSYIERKYGSCDDDGQTDKFDLCWKFDNASLALNGKSSELVKDDTSGVWRLKNDDASTVTRSTGADNGDEGDATDSGEHWTVTTGDGTKYVFGLNKLVGAGATDRTNSVWTVPVFGDDAGEPGYTAGGTFAERAKKQAWRWNLDYVEDTHGNAMSYWYEAETNNYDQLGDDNTGTSYTRGGYLKEIRYGQRKDALFTTTDPKKPAASDKVVLSYDERCIQAVASACNELTESSKDAWPDVPFDRICKDGDKCTGDLSPSFFTRKRLTTVTTYAWNAAATTPAFEPVDEWTLKHSYLDPGDTGDSADQSLWLQEIRRTGKHGTPITPALDPVIFTHEFLSNRVDGTSDDILPFYKPRLKTITAEGGAQTIVSYLPEDCVAGQTMPALDTNTRRCYPVYWAPNGGKTPILDWFQKYPVQAVSTTAPHGGLEAVEHSYIYGSNGAAWHYNNDPFTKEKERTWSSWRGYDQVTHLTGKSGTTQSKTVTVYMRGMNGDRVLGPDGKTPDPTQRKSVSVTGIGAGAATDHDQLAGFTRESVVYDGTKQVTGTVNSVWYKQTASQTRSYADTKAYFVRTSAVTTRTYITSSGVTTTRSRTVATAFDDKYGMPVTVTDRGDNSQLGDETCTRTWYARNDAVGINSLVSRTRVVANDKLNPVTDPCTITDADLDLPSDSSRPGQVISDTATTYDAATEWTDSQTPTVGDNRWTGRAKGYTSDNQPAWQKTSTLTYDSLGRVTQANDANDLPTASTTYTPPTSGPLTSTVVKNALDHSTTTLLDFATGVTTKTTDPNNKITESEYDALGRVTKVWLPNQLKALGRSPNYVYTYNLTNTAMPWVSTATIKGDGSGYNTSYSLYDSMLRLRQTQTPSPGGGAIISQTLYDSRGLTVSAQSDIWANSTQPSGNPVEIDGGQPPIQTDTVHDGAGRPVKTITKTRNVVRWTIDTAYLGDTVTTTAPDGGQANAVVTNAQGQTTERREYGGPQPTGDDYTATTYTYTPAGQQETVTGPDKTVWSYTYDLLGRQKSATDPDKGTSTTDYNELDQAVSTTDLGLNKTLISEYDRLGRKTGLWDGAKDDTHKLTAYTFDALLKGQLDTATRYDGGSGTGGTAYTQKVTSRDNLYQVTGSSLTLPTTDPLVAAGVPSTLAFSTVYSLDGSVKQYGNPAVAGLASEIVTYKYNYAGVGLQTQTNGTTGYQLGATYDPLGDLTELIIGTDGTSSAKKAYLKYSYEDGTRRLKNSYVTTDTHSYSPQNLSFGYDDAGNVTSIFDSTTLGGTAKADNQCFTYDGHRRLKDAWTPKTADCATAPTAANIDGIAPYWTSYTYTAAGQRDTETQHAAGGDTTTQYTYGKSDGTQPHTLTKTTTGSQVKNYGFDQAGNTTSRPGPQATQTLTWNSEGKLASLTEPAAGGKPAQATGYLYDATGELLIRRPTTTDGDTVLYLGGGNEVRLTVKDNGATKTLAGTRYYSAAGRTVAVRTAVKGATGTNLKFLASDHHGSSTLTMEAGTWAITRRQLTPFGSDRGTAPTSWPDDKAFLGKPEDDVTGLTHIGAREYDPTLGQFISVDPLLSLDQHQSLNGYSYANQHPATAADPTGLREVCGAYGNSCTPSGELGGSVPFDVQRPSEGDDYTVKPGGGRQGEAGGTHASKKPESDGGNWFSDFTGALLDEPVNFLGAMKDGVSSELSNIKNCVTWNGTCEQAFTDLKNRIDPVGAMASGLVGRVSEVYGDFKNGKSAEGTAKITFDVIVALATRKLGGRPCPVSNSFIPGTLVIAQNGKTVAIEDLAVGDKVLATDPETGETAEKAVTNVITGSGAKNLVEITIDTDGALGDDEETITATDGHPFWVPALKQWITATQLTPGQWLQTSAGTLVQIDAIKRWTQRATVHNLTVSDLHTYYVLAGATPVLVHNCNVGGVADGLPARAGGDPTVGQVVNIGDSGASRVGAPFKSGHSSSSDDINQFLMDSPDIANPASGPHASITHVETKLAWRMRQAGVTSLDVVINHSGGPCTGRFSCSSAVPAILPQGSSMTVWFRGAAGSMQSVTLHGRARG
ncbi:polymorphic toxin-type HINT domain-containing protein [Streptomyces sp. NPDC006464]|uniref:polymorphic toxin-type HINT domain-containing protein n=1 Tax=Streptomyces sp. NPDC006464 TaxID=3154305 RepID=UPI0033AA482A